MSWELVTLKECTVKCKNWNPKKSQGFFSYIDLSAVDKDLKKIVAVENYDCTEAPSRAKQIVNSGDVLVSTVRPNLNGVALVQNKHDGMTASTGYCVLRSNQQILNNHYLFHWTKTNTFIKNLLAVATGANYPAVSDTKIKDTKIPLPPLAEQKRIADILDKASALIEQRKQAIASLDELLQATFLDMFGDFIGNKPKYTVTSLIDVANRVTDGTHQSPRWSEKGIPFIFVSNINDRVIDFHTKKFIDEEEYFNLTKRCPIEENDILYTTVGSYGNPARVRNGVPKFAFQRHIAHIKLNLEKINPIYCEQMLDSQMIRIQADKNARGVAQKTLNLKQLKEFKILLPPLSLQKQFADIVEKVELQKEVMHKHLHELEQLFGCLQQKAFSGEL